MLLAAGLIVTGCAASGKSVKPPAPSDFAQLPPELRRACARPAELRDQALTQRETEDLWRSDRAALVTCRGRHAGTVKFVDDVMGRSRGK